jgi:LytS/YehU family sensor histidine kinase
VSYTNVPGGDYNFRVKLLAQGSGNTGMISIPMYVGTPFFKTIWFYVLIVLLIAVILYTLYHNRLRHHRQVLQLQGKAQLLEKEKAMVMYDGLKQQLNPHFLFNSLTSLNSLIATNPKTAQQFLEQMSAIYRYILKSRDHELVPLAGELKFVQTYIQLQQTRFGSGLQVHINTNEDHYSSKIVPVTLQNLIENAIKHNIIDKESPLVIDIFTQDEYLVVRNNLQKKKIVETSNRQGLRSMKALYGYLTRKPMEITEDEQFFTVKLPLI